MAARDSGRREVTTKGTNFRAFAGSLTRLRGAEALKATLKACPGEGGEAMRSGTIIASGWYPIGWYRALHATAQQVLGEGLDLPRALGREATTHDFGSIFRLLVKALSVEMAMGQVHRLLTLYYKGGKAETLSVKPGAGRIRFIGWTGFDRSIWEDLASSCEAVTEICGGKNVRRYILAGGRDGNDDLDLEVRWG